MADLPSSDATSRSGADGPAHHDSSSSMSTSGPDIAHSDEAGGLSVCRWQSAEFHGQECSRYFDCPSHVVERRGPHDEEGDQSDSTGRDAASNHADDGGQSSASRPDSGSSQREAPTESAHEITASSDVANQPPLISRATSQTELPSRGAANPTVSNLQEQLRHIHVTGSGSESSNLQTPASLGSGSPTSTRDTRRRSSYGFGETPTQYSLPPPPLSRREDDHQVEHDFVLPRWQPDVEVTLCPICHTQFSIFVRKHHCR